MQMSDFKKKPVAVAEEPAHSPLGPSSASRWLNCPGSVALCAGIPDTDSSFALEGTAAHTLSEWCRRDNKRAEKYLGKIISTRKVSGGFHEIEVNQEMVDGVQAFIDYVNEIPADVQIVEGRVKYTSWVKTGWGTLDDARIYVKKRRCKVTDFKYGKGVQVYAKENSQLKLYALGVFEDYGHLYDIDEFELCVHQPRLDHIDEWVVSTADILRWAEEVVRPGALATENPMAEIKAGEWCQFCRVKAICATRAEFMRELVVNDFEDLDAAQLRDVKLISNTDLAEKYLPHISAVKAWCKDIDDYALSQLQKGHEVGDYKLVEGRSKRSWTESVEKMMTVFKNIRPRMQVDTYAPRELITAPAAEKILGKKHAVMNKYVTKAAGKPVMVAGSDKRPALKVDPNAEFLDLGADEESWDN